MMNKSRGESAYLIFLFGSSQFSGNSARAKPKNEYDSVFACCCWFDEFCVVVFVAFVLRVRVLLLLVLQLLLQPTLGAVVRAGRSSILKNKFVVVVVVVVVVVLIVVVEKIRLSSFLCVKKKRREMTLRAT